MIELGDKEDTYDVSVVVTIAVKRIVPVLATSESHARELAKQQVRKEIERGEDQEWAIPQRSRYDASSDHEMLGPMMKVHHEAIQPSPIMTSTTVNKVSG